MLLVPTAVDHSAHRHAGHATPVVWVWFATVVFFFVLSRVVAFDHDQRLGWFSPSWFAGITFFEASGKLYDDPALFEIWQVWTHLVMHPVWWHLPIEIVIMLVIGRELERVIGSAHFAAALACLGPLGGIGLVLVGGESPYAGGLPMMLALVGLALGRLPEALTHWSLVWWAVVAAGQWPLFRLPLPSLLVLLLLPVMVGAAEGYALIHLLIVLVVAGLAAALGTIIRRTSANSEPAA